MFPSRWSRWFIGFSLLCIYFNLSSSVIYDAPNAQWIYFVLICNKFQFSVLMHYHSVQPVKIIDPHLVASFFDNYKRVYLHTTIELENRSSWVADCALNIQVSTELEEGICLVEHLQTQHLSISPSARVQYSFPEVSVNFTVIYLFFSGCWGRFFFVCFHICSKSM